MNTELHSEMPLGCGDETRAHIAYLTLELVRLASKLGYVVTVEQVPLQPLAMGHYSSRVSVRAQRVRS